MGTVVYSTYSDSNYNIVRSNRKYFYLPRTSGSFPASGRITSAELYLGTVYSFSSQRGFDVVDQDGNYISSTLYGDGSSASGNVGKSFTWDLDIDEDYYTGLEGIYIQGDDYGGDSESNVLNIRSGCEIRVTVEYEEYTKPVLNSSYPKDATVMKGASATFEARIQTAGNPASYSYQWYVDGSLVGTASGSTFTTTFAEARNYTVRCVVLHTAGEVSSRTATVQVLSAPVLDPAYPSDVTVNEGASATFEARVKTAGVPNTYTYQWYKDGTAIAGATSSTLATTFETPGTYQVHCVVYHASGEYTTRSAVVQVYRVPVLDSTYPRDVAVKTDESFTLEARMSTAGVPDEYSYQWYYGGASETTLILDATSSTLEMSFDVPGTYQVYCSITHITGTQSTRAATVTVSNNSDCFVRVGDAWKPGEAFVYSGGAWKPAELHCNVNNTWKQGGGQS